MSKNNFGVTDTTVSGVTPATITIPTLNWGEDFAILQNNKAGNVKLVNVTTGVDQEETIRFAVSNVTDAYAGSNVPVEYQETNKKGISILAQVTEISKVTDSAGNPHYIPQSMHLVYKGLMSAHLPVTDPDELLARLVASLYQDGTSRFAKLLKGAIMPKGL